MTNFGVPTNRPKAISSEMAAYAADRHQVVLRIVRGMEAHPRLAALVRSPREAVSAKAS